MVKAICDICETKYSGGRNTAWKKAKECETKGIIGPDAERGLIFKKEINGENKNDYNKYEILLGDSDSYNKSHYKKYFLADFCFDKDFNFYRSLLDFKDSNFKWIMDRLNNVETVVRYSFLDEKEFEKISSIISPEFLKNIDLKILLEPELKLKRYSKNFDPSFVKL